MALMGMEGGCTQSQNPLGGRDGIYADLLMLIRE
jgi:hypothetical protein